MLEKIAGLRGLNSPSSFTPGTLPVKALLLPFGHFDPYGP